MSEMLYKVPGSWSACAHVDAAKYHEMYAHSVRDPESFWGEHGKRIDWIKPYTWVKRTSFAPDNVSIEWFGDGTTNVSLNCIDRHLANRADQIAIIWEGDDPKESKSITYRQLHDEVCRFANVLKAHGSRRATRSRSISP
jgi:acetyl-CoA synthetase